MPSLTKSDARATEVVATSYLVHFWEQFQAVINFFWVVLVFLCLVGPPDDTMAKSKYAPEQDIPDLTGKVYFITGGTGGLGAETVRHLAAHNPSHIFFTGRNTSAAESLTKSVQSKYPSVSITFVYMDLGSLDSVQSATKQFLSLSSRLDVLICNAGIMALPAGVTKDGYELQWQVNHLGHSLLTKLLMPTLEKTAAEPNSDVRIVHLSSIAYRQAPRQGIDFPTLKTEQRSLGIPIIPGPKWSRYGQSKLANLLYAQGLAKNHPSITSVSVHPGVILTDLFSNVDFFARFPAILLSVGQRTTVEQGAYNQLWAATVAKDKLVNGEYYEPVGMVGKRTTRAVQDTKLAERLWEWTERELDVVLREAELREHGVKIQHYGNESS